MQKKTTRLTMIDAGVGKGMQHVRIIFNCSILFYYVKVGDD